MDYLIISKSSVRDNAFVDNNVEDKDIETAIQLAQQIDLQNTIGSQMYDYIIDEGADISGDYLTLLEKKVVPLLKWYTVYNLLNIKSAKITATGTSKEDKDNSIVLEIAELNRLSSVIKGYINSFEILLINYIEGNASKFSLYYTSSDEGVDSIGDENNNIIFDDNTLSDTHSLSYYKDHAFGF